MIEIGKNPEFVSTYQPLTFIISSKSGLGHVRRFLEIAKCLPKHTPTIVSSTPEVQGFIVDNLKSEKALMPHFCPLSYEGSASNSPEKFKASKLTFAERNSPLMQIVGDGGLIITDFVTDSVGLLNGRNSSRYFTLGSITTDLGIDYRRPDDQWTEQTANTINDMDFVLMPGIRRGKTPGPFMTESGTLIIPTGAIVPSPTKSPETVRNELNIPADGKYIVLQGGMQGSKELDFIISQIPNLPSEYYYVVMQWNKPENLPDLPNVRYISCPDGFNIINGAHGVITKPGGQTPTECISFGVPMLNVVDSHPKRMKEIEVVQKILEGFGASSLLDLNEDLRGQIESWLNNRDAQIEAFSLVPTNGAKECSNFIMEQFALAHGSSEKRPNSKAYPVDKPKNIMSEEDSAKKIDERKELLLEKLVQPLLKRGLNVSLLIYGGMGRGVLRESSDVDCAVVFDDEDIEKLVDAFGEFSNLDYPINKDRVDKMSSKEVSWLRLKWLQDNCQINISLMPLSVYKRIISFDTDGFPQEIFDNRSSNPFYSVTDYKGNELSVPKIVEVSGEDANSKKQIRLSPGSGLVGDVEIIGLMSRAFLTSEIIHNELEISDPAVKLMVKIAYKICQHNDFFEYRNERISRIKPEAFNSDNLFRLIRDPDYMISEKEKLKLIKIYRSALNLLNLSF